MTENLNLLTLSTRWICKLAGLTEPVIPTPVVGIINQKLGPCAFYKLESCAAADLGFNFSGCAMSRIRNFCALETNAFRAIYSLKLFN